jgi:hypothetical protein
VFDGDGMVCGVRIKDGLASFSSAWVRTERWRIEDAAGAAVLPKLGDMHGATGLGILMLQHAKGCARGGHRKNRMRACAAVRPARLTSPHHAGCWQAAPPPRPWAPPTRRSSSTQAGCWR